MKYKTLDQLIAAYESGELSRENDVMVVDNDCASVYHEATDEDVFEGGMPEKLLREALTLLGIPWQDA